MYAKNQLVWLNPSYLLLRHDCSIYLLKRFLLSTHQPGYVVKQCYRRRMYIIFDWTDMTDNFLRYNYIIWIYFVNSIVNNYFYMYVNEDLANWTYTYACYILLIFVAGLSFIDLISVFQKPTCAACNRYKVIFRSYVPSELIM